MSIHEAQQPRRGRPPLPKAALCVEQINIAVSGTDKLRFVAAAQRDGQDLSNWMKGLADKRDAETL